METEKKMLHHETYWIDVVSISIEAASNIVQSFASNNTFFCHTPKK